MATMERGDMKPGFRRPQPTPDDRPSIRNLDDLMSRPNVRRWTVRLGAAVIAGVLAAIVFTTTVGLLLAVLVVVADMVRVSRTDSSVDAWRRPSAAERRTERQLRNLAKNGYQVLHARAVPRDDAGASDGKIDHLVIGPSGVYAIDSEKWNKQLPVRTMSHRKLFHGPFNQKEKLDEARWEADQAARKLSQALGYDIDVQPSVAIYGPSIPWKVMRVRDVDVYAGNRAKSYLRRQRKTLTPTDVHEIARAAERALPPVYAKN